MKAKRYNTKIKSIAEKLVDDVKFLISTGNIIEIKVIKATRTNVQNSALHVYFTKCANALNENGFYYRYFNIIKGHDVEIEWDMDLFKKHIWKVIQLEVFGHEKTSRLKTNEIDPVYNAVNKWMSELGIEVNFPNQFDKYVENYR